MGMNVVIPIIVFILHKNRQFVSDGVPLMRTVSRIADRFSTLFDRVLNAMAFLGGVLLAFSVLSISAEVFSRYLLNYPFGWVTEISSYSLLYITFLVAAWVLRSDDHIKVDAVIKLFKPRTQSLLHLITLLTCSLMCLILVIFGAKVSLDLYKSDYFTPTMLELPKYLILSIIFVGYFTLFVQFVRKILDHLKANEK